MALTQTINAARFVCDAAFDCECYAFERHGTTEAMEGFTGGKRFRFNQFNYTKSSCYLYLCPLLRWLCSPQLNQPAACRAPQ